MIPLSYLSYCICTLSPDLDLHPYLPIKLKLSRSNPAISNHPVTPTERRSTANGGLTCTAMAIYSCHLILILILPPTCHVKFKPRFQTQISNPDVQMRCPYPVHVHPCHKSPTSMPIPTTRKSRNISLTYLLTLLNFTRDVIDNHRY